MDRSPVEQTRKAMTTSEDERDEVEKRRQPEWPGAGLDNDPIGRPAASGGEPPVAEPPADGAEESGDEPAKAKKPKKKGSFWKELPILIVIALVLTFLIQTFIARVYSIPSGSMELTLNGCTGCVGDRILVDKLTYDFTNVSPGDVVVFEGPPGWEESEYNVDQPSNVFVKWIRQFGSSIGIGSPPEYDLVKRVIATGGQTVSCCDAQNRVIVDGKPLNEPYIYFQPGYGNRQATFKTVTVPKGDIWVMGDNRNNSWDSRYQAGGGLHGVVPESDVIGIARIIIWPPNRWRGVGEINAQAMALSAPAWQEGIPLGLGAAAAWPTLWLGKRTRAGLRAGAGALRTRRRRKRR
jgi:signal peptidase I